MERDMAILLVETSVNHSFLIKISVRDKRISFLLDAAPALHQSTHRATFEMRLPEALKSR